MREEIFPMLAIFDQVPKEMIDKSIETEEDYIGWRAIPSTITKEDLAILELDLNCKLPESYKAFLRYKYFLELRLSDIAIRFPKHLPNSKLKVLKKLNLEFHLPQKLISKGYFCFADFHDYGILAFNTNIPKDNNEFEVVVIMHDNLDQKYFYANSFKELMNFEHNRSNEFIEMMNNLNKK